MKRLLAAALVGLSVSSLAHAQFSGEYGDRRLKLLEDPLSVRFTGDPDKISKAKMQQAIDIAALARDWKVLNAADGRFELQTTKNGQHVLHVIVTYGDAFCEIHYIDSVEMMYKEMSDRGRNLRVIHGNYNVWIRELAETIGKRIEQPVRISAPAPPPPVVAAAPSGKSNGNFYSRKDYGARYPGMPTPRTGGGGGGGAGAVVPGVPLVHSRVVPPPSGFAALDDVDKVPVREAGKDRYRTFLTAASPKAFVVGEDGSFAVSVRNPDAMALALDDCTQRKIGCWLYAVDGRVVFAPDPQKRISNVDQLPRAAR
jgi:hypothetical protein